MKKSVKALLLRRRSSGGAQRMGGGLQSLIPSSLFKLSKIFRLISKQQWKEISEYLSSEEGCHEVHRLCDGDDISVATSTPMSMAITRSLSFSSYSCRSSNTTVDTTPADRGTGVTSQNHSSRNFVHPSKYGDNILHSACRLHPPVYVVRDIIRVCRPECVSETNSVDQTALHVAAAHGAAPQVIDLLLRIYPRAAKLADCHGRTPLHLCCEHCCQPQTCDPGGNTGEEVALVKGPLLEVVQLLCAAGGSSINLEDEEDMTPLEYAIFNGADVKVVKALQKASAKAWKKKLPSGDIGGGNSSIPPAKTVSQRSRSSANLKSPMGSVNERPTVPGLVTSSLSSMSSAENRPPSCGNKIVPALEAEPNLPAPSSTRSSLGRRRGAIQKRHAAPSPAPTSFDISTLRNSFPVSSKPSSRMVVGVEESPSSSSFRARRHGGDQENVASVPVIHESSEMSGNGAEEGRFVDRTTSPDDAPFEKKLHFESPKRQRSPAKAA